MPGSVLIIPAAGLGTRLQTTMPKALVPVNGKAMVDHLLDLYGSTVERFVLVLHPSFERLVRLHCAQRPFAIEYVLQDHQTGMLHAILSAGTQLRAANPSRVWITWCDQIGVEPMTIQALKRLSDEHAQTALIFPTSTQADPYIHLVRDPTGRIVDVLHRREGDVMPGVGESDMGLFSLSADAYFAALPQFAAETVPAPKTGEKNFLPFIPWLSEHGADVLTFPCQDSREAIGINTADDLQAIEGYLRERGGTVTSR
jgi:bifunctional N-acetylglucosamine-1-phosphate-uridyltransferase/glucosamine-1-phosphate-acetyltransferase GlmU-like protein